jgi:hypothetical protein
MSRTRLVVYGAGYLGQQIYHHLAAWYGESAEVLGFIDDTKPAGLAVIDGKSTLGALETVRQDPALGPQAARAVFAIGYTSMTARRAALERVVAAGYTLFSVLHPRAVIEPGADPGPGSVVLACAVLDQQVRLGAACFVDIGVRLGAGTVAGANNYFSSGTSTGSRVQIGDDCFFGMDCTLTTDVKLGSNLFVNAKTLVPRDVGSNLKLVELHKSRELPLPR